ncbi:hypothetical protein K2X89_04155, partial [Myxococcota bacterium]|nr:hypothetical protein [Myxococcota bacterium]
MLGQGELRPYVSTGVTREGRQSLDQELRHHGLDRAAVAQVGKQSVGVVMVRCRGDGNALGAGSPDERIAVERTAGDSLRAVEVGRCQDPPEADQRALPRTGTRRETFPDLERVALLSDGSHRDSPAR